MTCFNSKLFADNVAKLCYDKFENNLPKSGKPILQKEWTLISCIIMHNNNENNDNQIVSLATGSKCIGQNKITNDGTVLNDSHAEVLARRGFLRYVYHQIKLSKTAQNSIFQYDLESKKYKLMKNITFHLFTSHVPCGDAAIFPILKPTSPVLEKSIDSEPTSKKRKITEESEAVAEEEEESRKTEKELYDDINRTGAKCLSNGVQDHKLPGIGYHVTGIVRTKPGRGDRTLSVSCSDKIAKWNCLGIQGALLSLLIEEIYLTTIIVGCPSHQFSCVALKRAVIDRVSPFINRAPLLLHSELVFKFRKNNNLKPSPNAIVWCQVDTRNHEVAVEGKRLGCTKGKKGSELLVSRKCILKSFHEISENKYENRTYGYIKEQSIEYENKWKELKKHLGNWSEKPKEFISFT